MADLNERSSSAIAYHNDTAVTAARIQPYPGSDRYQIGQAMVYSDQMFMRGLEPKSGATSFSIDSVTVTTPGTVGSIKITGKRSTPPTAIPGVDTGDGSGAALWISDGTSPYGADGDVYLSRRLTTSATATHAVLAPMTRVYSDYASTGTTIATDTTEASLGVQLANLPPGTYWMSYSCTLSPSTAWEDRNVILWVQGSTAGTMTGSVTSMNSRSGTSIYPVCHAFVAVVSATDTFDVMGKVGTSGTHTVAPTEAVFVAYRIA